MTQHTSGQWTVDHDELESEVRAGDWVIAVCCDQPGDGDTKANAQLIAAAPELLEVVTAIIYMLANEWRPIDILDAHSPLVSAARCALAKATGSAA